MFVTSLLPASYTGVETVTKLAGQTAHLLNSIPLDEEDTALHLMSIRIKHPVYLINYNELF